jgi:hypothetical protein
LTSFTTTTIRLRANLERFAASRARLGGKAETLVIDGIGTLRNRYG